MINEIKRIAESIRDTEKDRMKLADFLKTVSPQLKIVEEAKPGDLDGKKIAGVDGGLLKHSFHGLDIVLARAVGVCFSYTKGKVDNVLYHPSKSPPATPFTMEALQDIDFIYFASVSRQQMEIKTATECIEKFKPDVLLLDGPIAPHYSSKPHETSPIYPQYERLIKLYDTLYKTVEKEGVLLAGVVEDSRSDRFCSLVKKDILSKVNHVDVPKVISLLDKSRDTNMLFWVLDKNQKTLLFNYSDEIDKHPTLKDLNKEIFSFYLKTAKYDRPVRVDILDKKREQEIASLLLSISGYHSSYGFPTVLIEADNVAKLSEQEIDNFYYSLLKYTGNIPSMMKLRREQRPF